jgi:hypothetical protein
MNTSPSTPNLESLRQAIQDFTPNPRRVPFNNLKPLHDAIVELRGKNASYAIIAELLMQNGVKTSVARVAEYGRIVLDGGKAANGGNMPAPHRPRFKLSHPHHHQHHRSARPLHSSRPQNQSAGRASPT